MTKQPQQSRPNRPRKTNASQLFGALAIVLASGLMGCQPEPQSGDDTGDSSDTGIDIEVFCRSTVPPLPTSHKVRFSSGIMSYRVFIDADDEQFCSWTDDFGHLVMEAFDPIIRSHGLDSFAPGEDITAIEAELEQELNDLIGGHAVHGQSIPGVGIMELSIVEWKQVSSDDR